ncbi:WXG100 family type VII secretion target [Streptomyces natalensis]|uniref:WXG100 family type VII secretion target n=1 Tax=Streptomyces natalensis ATCC 27448 TaxID=1240678 RepID=A0A0D7CHT5_9ACTN|nr:WXG100 family type VII secretion target [Streptomyces natalensis]KIZ15420.1 hypothetical protein SNA_28110 [Streptomyces natalensis ATCC 27448]
MAGNLSGADLEALLKLSQKFKTDSGHLHSLFTNLSNEANSSEAYWTGRLANTFRDEWKALQPHLTKIVQVLEDAHNATKTHHANIQKATQGH